MTIDEFLQAIENKAPPAPADKSAQLEGVLGGSLPDDYRRFLEACSGGYVGGSLWYKGPTPTGDSAGAGVHHIGGFREESYVSLAWARESYARRIPQGLIWIMNDPFGNAICLGVRGPHRGRVYFWDHEIEPAPDGWDGQIDTAGNVSMIAASFSEFVVGLRPTSDE